MFHFTRYTGYTGIEKNVLVRILHRKIRIKFYSKPYAKDLESLKDAIQREAETDQHLRQSLHGKIMRVTQYYEEFKEDCEVRNDESIANGAILTIFLETDSSIKLATNEDDSGDDKEKQATELGGNNNINEMEKTVCVCILNRKKKIKFSHKQGQSDVDSLKEAIGKVAIKDRHLQLNLQGNTMAVSRYCQFLECECEVEEDECIENGSIFNIQLIKEERISECGLDEEQESAGSFECGLTTEFIGSRNTKVRSPKTEDEIPRIYKNMQEVTRRKSEHKFHSKFEMAKSAKQRGYKNAMANITMGHFDKSPVTNYYYTSSPETLKENFKDVLRNKMEKWYKKRALLPQVPWLKKMDSENILKNYYITLEENETKVIIPIQELFQDLYKRILIESPAGFGKTTLTMKIAYDWAHQEEYMKRFDFVFVLLLRELQGSNIEETINSFVNRLMNSYIDSYELQEYLKFKNVLLLFDGYDELPNDGIRQTVNDILSEDKNECQPFTILTTCRTGLFQTERSKFGFNKRKLFCDRRIDIVGLTEDQMKKLLQHILPEDDVNQVFNEIVTFGEELPEMIKCPMYVMMLAYLHMKQETLEFGMGRTEFYKKMMTTLLKGRKRSILSEPSESFENIFTNPSMDLQLTKHDLIEFCKLCWELIAESGFAFVDSEIIRKMYKVGFLTESENFLSEDSVYYYKPIHRSFAEFFAAYYLFREMQISKDKYLFNERIEMLSEQFVLSKGTTLIHSFLLGFLGEESYILFNQLKPLAYVYSQMEAGFWNMLVDCSPKQETIESLISFIPLMIESQDDCNISNEMFTNVIRKGTQKTQIEGVRCHLNVCQTYKLPSEVSIEKISLIVWPHYLRFITDDKKTLFANPDIQCNKLIIVFNGKYDNDDHIRKSVANWFKLITSVKFNSLSFVVFENSTCLLLNESIMKDESLGKFEIYSFYCEVRDQDRSWIKFLSSLISSNKLVRLHLTFETQVCQTALKPITIQAGKSEKLNGFSLWNSFCSPIEIDLDDLLKNSKHQWHKINISGCQINIKNSFHINMDVTFLSLLPRNDCIPNFGNSVIKSFYCEFPFLLKMQESKHFHSSTFQNNLQEITVEFNNANFTGRNLSKINEFGTIKKLTMNLNWSISTIPEELFGVLKATKIEHLEIWFYENNTNAIASFISSFATFSCQGQQEDNLSIKTIVLYMRSNNSLYSKKILNPLLKCLEEKRLKTVAVIRPGWLESEPIYFQWIHAEKFDLNLTLAGSKEVDMEFWKNQYIDNIPYHQIDITLR